MKYRRLHRAELEELEQQFIVFLAAQGVPAEDWVSMKLQDEERANALIDAFSEAVFARILPQVSYLIQYAERSLLTYRCGPEMLAVRGILVKGGPPFNFDPDEEAHELARRIAESESKMKLISGERPYKAAREEEIYKLMEAGALIADNADLFDFLEQLGKPSATEL